MSFRVQTYAEALEKAKSRSQRARTAIKRRSSAARLREVAAGAVSLARTSNRLSPSRKTSPTKVAKKKKTKRAKLMTRKRAIKVLDDLTSQIVRLIGPLCVQCGSTEKLTCGHVLSRRSHATRWDFENCFTQCWPCNFAHSAHSPFPYYRWFVERFGQSHFDALYAKWSAGRKYSTPDLREMVTEYREKLKALQEG